MPNQDQEAKITLQQLRDFAGNMIEKDTSVHLRVWNFFEEVLFAPDEIREKKDPIPYFIEASRYLYDTRTSHNERCKVIAAIFPSWQKAQHFTTTDDLMWLKNVTNTLKHGKDPISYYEFIRPKLLWVSYFFMFIHMLKIILGNSSSNEKVLLVVACISSLTFSRTPEARQVPPPLPDWVETGLSEKMKLSSSEQTQKDFRM